ncbi:MAG TPA: ABC transporter substrate-binding protein [Burkholderiaceae bacterium]|nr:ABC transporter substrate-binding protein [Burkholderiaceae bacterium]
MTLSKPLVAAALALGVSSAALADITVGISLPLTGPANGLGIPMQNYIKLWPESVAGEKLKVILLDDASDPTRAVQNARKFVTEDKVDIVMGSSVTVNAVAMAETVAESGTVQLMFSPAALQAGKDHWAFRLPQGNAVMAHAVIEHMKKQGIKSVGFLGYTDAYGETWLNDFKAQTAALGGPPITVVERFARPDTSVTGQALKLVQANPDAILVVASGSGAAMPHKGLIERGYKGKIYQTHAAATRDLMRIGGKDVEGGYVVSGPALVPEQLPEGHPSKKVAQDFVNKYEKAYGPGSRNQFAGHAYDAIIVLDKVVPVAKAKAKPGTPEFRAALRDAIENMGRTVLCHGVITYSKDNHWGFTTETPVMLKVVNGDWKIEPSAM